MDKSNYFWYSFSLDGENAGVVITKDEEEVPGTEEAGAKILARLATEGLVPRHDHCRAFSVNEVENDLEVDRLYTKQEMTDRDYESTNSKRDE
jgi:hypothetical protein